MDGADDAGKTVALEGRGLAGRRWLYDPDKGADDEVVEVGLPKGCEELPLLEETVRADGVEGRDSRVGEGPCNLGRRLAALLVLLLLLLKVVLLPSSSSAAADPKRTPGRGGEALLADAVFCPSICRLICVHGAACTTAGSGRRGRRRGRRRRRRAG